MRSLALLLLLTLQIWPIVYTVATAFTNYGQGHTLNKQEATDQSVAQSVKEVAGTERYKLSIAVPEGADPATGELAFLLRWRREVEAMRAVGPVERLEQQLALAVSREQYEEAARLRDQIRRLREPAPPAPRAIPDDRP